MKLKLCRIRLHRWGKWSNQYFELYEVGLPTKTRAQRLIWVGCRARICEYCGIAQVSSDLQQKPYIAGDENDGRLFAPSWGCVEGVEFTPRAKYHIADAPPTHPYPHD